MKVPILDLSYQYRQIKKDFDLSFKELTRRCDFILGQDVSLFENDFARYCGRKFAVGVNSGTDALFLSLLSLGVGLADEVIVPAFTYIATALAVSYTGAKPVFVDIDEQTYNLNPQELKSAVTRKTKAIIPVHLYGQPAQMHKVSGVAQEFGLKIIEDAAQAHGARYRSPEGTWHISGSMGDAGAFSFYPTKNLGAFGDGGMVVTDDEKMHKKLLMLRDYGRKSRYEHVSLGYNSRLDTVQAAVLRAKLKHLDAWNKMRRRKAKIYDRELEGARGVSIPQEADYSYHVYHVYGLRIKERDRVTRALTKNKIGWLIHYPIPLHMQEVYRGLGYKKGDFPVAESVAAQIVSLPMYPDLKEAQIKFVCKVIKESLRG